MQFSLEQWLLIGVFGVTLAYDVVKGFIDWQRMKDQRRIADNQTEIVKIQADLLALKKSETNGAVQK